MKYIFTILFLFCVIVSHSQNLCSDSSFLKRYKFTGNGGLRIEATIAAKDSGKIFAAHFFSFNTGGVRENFIIKTDKAGDIIWVKRINDAQSPASPFSVNTIAESANGNIFITISSANLNNKPDGYIVLSRDGNIVNQQRIDVLNIANINLLGQGRSLILSHGQDSIMMVFVYKEGGHRGDRYYIVSTDMNGNTGAGYLFKAPDLSRNFSFLYLGAVENNTIKLWLTTRHYNTHSCQPGFPVTDEFTYLTIDWLTKTVMQRRVYCRPYEASWVGYMAGNQEITGSSNHYHSRSFFYKTNDKRVIIARRYLGLAINGNDTANRLFSVSEFDDSFSHLKSYYITANNRFKNKALYELDFDKTGNGRIKVFDYEEKALFYSFNNNAEFLSTKKKELPTVNYTFPLLGNDMNYGTGSKNIEMIVGDVDGNSFLDLYSIKKDEDAVCFGEEVGQVFFSQPATVSELDWNGNFTVERANIYSSAMNFEVVDKPFEQQELCKTVNICNSIIINPVETSCNINKPVIITAKKNVQCNGSVAFAFDTTAVQHWEQPDDTTLVLTFAKNYRGKVFARPNSCDMSVDSVEIIVQNTEMQLNLGENFIYCPGKTYTLIVENDLFHDFKWQDNSTNNNFTVNQPGKYYVSAKDYCGNNYSDTIIVAGNDFEFFKTKQVSICDGEKYTISIADGYVNYNWYSSETFLQLTPNSVRISPSQNALYFVSTEVFNGCVVKDSLEVLVKKCPQHIYFPNAFTPNGDGKNDIFQANIAGVIEEFSLEIYNRWGQLVFKSRSPLQGWDGRIKGVLQNSDTFVWYANYRFYGKERTFLKGVLTLLK